MSDRAALLAAICAHPDEDTPRLVFADYLDEHGEAKRAAFIRSQIEYHRQTTADDAVADQYVERMYFDLPPKAADWAEIDPEFAKRIAARAAFAKGTFNFTLKSEGVPRVKSVSYRNNARGFFDHVYVSDAAEFLKHASAIFRAAPITGITFDQLTGEEARAFVAAGHLARVRALSLRDDTEEEAVRAFGAHRDAAGVRSLTLDEPYNAAEVVEALTIGRYWTGLEALDVSSLDYTDDPPDEDQMAALFARRQLRNLRTLTAYGSDLDDYAAAAVARNMPALRDLDLSDNRITGEGAAALAASKTLRHLRCLDLNSCVIQDGEAVAALVTTPALPALTVLDVSGSDVSDRNTRGPAAKALAAPGRGPGLRVLGIGGRHFTAVALEALAKCPALRGLWSLSLVDANVTDDALERFVANAAFDNLVHLELRVNQITARGATALAAWPGGASLLRLDLSTNAIGEGGAKALAASPHLTRLKALSATGRGTATLKKWFKKAFR